MGTVRTYLELVRPANVVTAWADVGAGAAAAWGVSVWLGLSGSVDARSVGLLLLATSGLYAGGVVLNDVFDAPLDRRERPERPIPSGRVGRLEAAMFGAGLLVFGMGCAAVAGAWSGVVAAAVAFLAVGYDAWGKQRAVLGPLNMGAARGGNLLLGVSAVPAALGALWAIALVPVAYIAAVTAVSRGEVRGGSRHATVFALALLGGVIVALVGLGAHPAYELAHAAPFAALLAAGVGPAFVHTLRSPDAGTVQVAVRRGVIALIVLDATLAAGFASWRIGGVVLLTLPLSVGLARRFAVT